MNDGLLVRMVLCHESNMGMRGLRVCHESNMCHMNLAFHGASHGA